MSELKLCYIDEPWAFFTTQELSEQWGDDWDDRPYEWNAGDPYRAYKDGESWEIVKVAYEGDFETPSSWTGHGGSQYCVKDINRRVVPWLQTDRYTAAENKHVQIWAGTVLREFIVLVKFAGGTVWTEES